MIKKYVRPFFFENGNDYLKPVRFFMTIILLLIIISFIIKLSRPDYLTDNFILSLVATLSALIGGDTWRANTKTKNGNNS